MSKRNFLDEITRLRDRNEFRNGLFSKERLVDLLIVAENIDQKKDRHYDEFFRYMPIATVACLESFSRTAVQLLVDKGGIYFDNLSVLFKRLNQKIDFDLIAHLHKQQFTIGEFVSHLISCNNLSDMNANLSDILGRDFLSLMGAYTPVSQFGDRVPALGEDFEEIKASISRSFTLRHIFCHESGRDVSIERSEMINDVNHCLEFLEAAADFIGSTLYKDWGMYPEGIVEKLRGEWQRKESELPVKLSEIKTKRAAMQDYPEEYLEKFDETIEHWKKYMEASARVKSTYSPSATWSNYAYLEDKIKSADDLLENLQ